MNCTLETSFIFIVGVAVGSIVTFKLVKDKYERFAQEEIDSVKEVFSKKSDTKNRAEEEEELEEEPEGDIKKSSIDYSSMVNSNGYISYTSIAREKNNDENVVRDVDMKVELTDDDRPYVISPDEYGTKEGYDTIPLTYYADGVLSDDLDDEIEEKDIDYLIGVDSLRRFGEYEKDILHVRNDLFTADYEIARDNRNFSDLAEPKYPHQL